MDIAAMSTQMAQMNIANQVGASMLNLTKDVMVQQGQGLQKLLASTYADRAVLEQSVNPSIGGNIDIRL